MPNQEQLSNAIGERGEDIFKLTLTDYHQFSAPLFQPAFLGDKREAIDFYVELLGVPKSRPFFLAQVKTTAQTLPVGATALGIPRLSKVQCEKLYSTPGPTYLFGVHEPTQKVYVLSVHQKPTQGVYQIPLIYELTPQNLELLYNEVRDFWNGFHNKPMRSHFS